ncbi:DUF5017 domain-containing protein [Pedobacter sp. GR22-6]|uniref:DUF5017 domain-containing protein n=1 Tax=Pedobacter sp. GR22-6 TaxID=3127957 RepID=UPI00307F4627
MNTKYLTGKLAVLLALCLFGCKKNEIERPEFNATVNKSTYKVGDTVVFNMEGNPDFVTFYSGEYGNDYAYIGGRTLDIKSFKLAFQTRVRNGNQPNQFSVHISNNFNGKFDIESVRSGNFQDITSMFTLSTVNTVYANSGEVDLTPMVTDKTKPLYIGFRYICKPQTAASGPNGTQRNWDVRELTLKTLTNIGETTAIDQLSGAWSLVESGAILEEGRNTVNLSSGLITLRGNATAAGKLVETEAWAISKAVDLNTVILGPDKSIPVKSLSETLVPLFSHVYTQPGTYKVVFVYTNHRIEGKKTALKEIEITVEP